MGEGKKKDRGKRALECGQEPSGDANLTWGALKTVLSFRWRNTLQLDGSTAMNVSAQSKPGSFLSALKRVFGSSAHQKAEQVLVREPGRRVYGAPLAVSVEAIKHWEFALLSRQASLRAEAAKAEKTGRILKRTDSRIPGFRWRTVRRTKDASGVEVFAIDSFDAGEALRDAGWELCKDYPGEAVAPQLESAHLRVEVWKRSTPPAFAVAFGGTVATCIQDWISNLRWFMPWHDDEYTKLVKLFVPAFTEIFLKSFPDSAPVIYATGHSLGGGLAQQFAYALPKTASLHPKVIQVFAFDPSPVTGYRSLHREIRERNARNLLIERIFERYEILSILRSALALVRPTSVANPAVRAVRYNFEGRVNSIRAHGIAMLAEDLYNNRMPEKNSDVQMTPPSNDVWRSA